MADPATSSPTETVSGTIASGAAGQGSVLDQLAAQMAALTNTVNELTNKLNTVSQSVRNTSTTEDTNMEVSTVGNDDAFLTLQNARVSMSAINAATARIVNAGADHYAALLARSLDHFAALPPMAPRSATGPGNSAS